MHGAVPGRTPMLRLATDADVHGDIIRGLRRRVPDIDLVRIQDTMPEGTADPDVLAWAAVEKRTLITNDRNTMVGFAYERVTAGESVPGLIVTTIEQSIGSAIEDILLIAECMPEEEISHQVVVYLPLRGYVLASRTGSVTFRDEEERPRLASITHHGRTRNHWR